MKKIMMLTSILMVFLLVGCGLNITHDEDDSKDSSLSRVLSCVNESVVPSSYSQKTTTKYFFTGNNLVSVNQEMIMTVSDASQYTLLKSVWEETAIALETEDEGGSINVTTSYDGNVYTMNMEDLTPNDRADGFEEALDDIGFKTTTDTMIEVHEAMNYTCVFE